jgi:shikimate kinase
MKLIIMDQNENLILVMVGLPARGKSYLAKKMARYLNWFGVKSKVFNVGMYRRSIFGPGCDSTFFDNTNQEAFKALEQITFKALNDLIGYLSGKGFY